MSNIILITTEYNGDMKRHTYTRDFFKRSKFIETMLEDTENDAEIEIPISNMTSKQLLDIVELLSIKLVKTFEKPITITEYKTLEDFLPTEFIDFCKRIDPLELDNDYSQLSIILNNANYLNIQELLDMLCSFCAFRLKDKSVDEIRTIFNIEVKNNEECKQAM